MNDVVPTFPLLRLPKKAVLNTLRIMAHLEIFGISILSMKAKNLVESLKLKTRDVHVSITDNLFVILQFHNQRSLTFNFYQVKENDPIQELETPDNIYIFNGNTSVMWANSLSVKQMLDHFRFIFHASINLLCFGVHCERFSFESIQKNVKGFRTICLTSANHEHNRRVLSVFKPAELDLLEDSTGDGHIHRFISIQNFDVICAGSLQITLDDLLVFNARLIHLGCNRSYLKIPNHFLKLWRTGSNSRLEYLNLQFLRVHFREEELLEGLEYQHVPPNRRRLFKPSGHKSPTEVIGGWDIQRFDGTQATINYGGNGDHVYFELFVWHDHCVAIQM